MRHELQLVLTRKYRSLRITFRKIESQRWKFAKAQAALAAYANLYLLFSAVRFENKWYLGTIVLFLINDPIGPISSISMTALSSNSGEAFECTAMHNKASKKLFFINCDITHATLS